MEKVPSEFDGPCSVCGKPGFVQGLPDAPTSDIFCAEHAPSFTLSPLSVLFALVVLAALAYLAYYWLSQ